MHNYPGLPPTSMKKKGTLYILFHLLRTRIPVDKEHSLKSARKLILSKLAQEDNLQFPVRRERSRMNGKKAIRMSDSAKKRRASNEESFALRKMEPFVCAFFCEGCQEGSHYDGEVLSIKTCNRCRSRFVNHKM
ncbi:hypothetical protein CAEBREN_05084 [Caenorhabditis brenneri]|uniref:Uncharacterized protein n=1 Tax=Caenorhabditis brenneri TaxID=135651 RepID=G0ME77_CAEBE|nr:hypothetical protein CAEBREN_05084 [Caenorhabditis brenneri]